jgi:hypothetical protein
MIAKRAAEKSGLWPLSGQKIINGRTIVKYIFCEARRMRKLVSVAKLVALATCCQAAVAQAPSPLFDIAAKQELIVKVSAALTANYIFPDKTEEAKAKIEASLKSGGYNSIGDQSAFAEQLTDDLLPESALDLR